MPSTWPRSTARSRCSRASTRRAPFGLAFYLAGADPHEGDRLGRLKLSAAGLLPRDRRVLAALGAARIPVALTMAGGYGRDIDVTVAIQAATIDAAIAAWRDWRAAERRARGRQRRRRAPLTIAADELAGSGALPARLPAIAKELP